MEQETRRARRIRMTKKVASRRRSDFVERLLDGDASGSRGARTSAHYWHKTSIGCCSCRKKHHGAPRRDKGMCDLGARARIYHLRRQARELNLLVTRHRADPDGDEVALMTGHGNLVNDLW